MAVSPRSRDKAALLLIGGCFLLMSPILLAVKGPHKLFGLPLIVLYIFGVWGGLILAGALISKSLGRDDGEKTPDSMDEID